MEMNEKTHQLDEGLKGIIGSLLIWGFITLGFWFPNTLIHETIYNQVSITRPLIWFGFYGQFILGELMILLGFLSMLSFRPHILLFGGLSFLLVGLWNLSYQLIITLVLNPYLKPYYLIIESNKLWYVLGIMQLIWGFKQLLTYSEVRNEKTESQETQLINWRFIIYPFGKEYLEKPLYLPDERGPRWHWGAFFVPAVWFMYHEMLGVTGIILIFEFFIGTWAYFFGFYAIFIGVLLAHIFAAYFAHSIYYMRYGKWLKA